MSPLLKRIERDRIARQRAERIDHEELTIGAACFFAGAAGALLLLSWLALAA